MAKNGNVDVSVSVSQMWQQSNIQGGGLRKGLQIREIGFCHQEYTLIALHISLI